MKFNLATGLVCLLATTEAVGASNWWSKAGKLVISRWSCKKKKVWELTSSQSTTSGTKLSLSDGSPTTVRSPFAPVASFAKSNSVKQTFLTPLLPTAGISRTWSSPTGIAVFRSLWAKLRTLSRRSFTKPENGFLIRKILGPNTSEQVLTHI